MNETWIDESVESIKDGDWTIQYDGKFTITYRNDISGAESAFRVDQGFGALLYEAIAQHSALSG